MNAIQIITANTKAHTSDGYTSWHMVAAAHEATIRRLVDELNVLQGLGQTPASGCHHAELIFGDTSVLVEFEAEEASGDNWNEPRHEATVAVLRVLINGAWCDAEDVVPDAVIERWETELLEGRAGDAQMAADDAAEARAEARREFAEEWAA